ncbi:MULTISPECIES: alpha/beta fold hydrolase [unclassified Roseateles]|uniref:alpha/beta fold hydrolase n=1 Tax=unclassified Roseateles TaxID=2626991 RepID=UPI0006FF0467|nr:MULTISPECIES: alpha/beta hydrolase [unclassified Roseateles]KQW43831.1 alpha/beta hydrolase [Pelomonas sp. Root405]KRA71580.1 alpha/beta hydrolase [Pelomonas sp. Root662]
MRFGDFTLKALGVLLMLAALGFAVSKAPDRSLDSLVARWAPPPSDFVELDGQLVHFRDQGPSSDPLPLVLIHGTGASLHTWEGWVAELAQTRRVISFDLPGFGLTGPNADHDYSNARYIAFVRNLLSRLGVGRAIVGGNSLGGEIAWQLALADPALVAGLVLVDAAGFDFTPESLPLGFRIARIPVVREPMRWLLPRRAIEASVLDVYGDPGRVTAALVDRYYELTLREGNRVALMRRMDQLGAGPVERLGDIKVPTLILWGERDRLIPPQWGREFKKGIPNSHLVVFPKLGHVPQEEDPAATLAALRDWLSTVTR